MHMFYLDPQVENIRKICYKCMKCMYISRLVFLSSLGKLYMSKFHLEQRTTSGTGVPNLLSTPGPYGELPTAEDGQIPAHSCNTEMETKKPSNRLA